MVEHESDLWTTKNNDFDTLRAPKASQLGSFFDADLIDFEDDGDKQCIEINVLFF